MKNEPRRRLPLAVVTTLLVILTSPPAAPRLVLGTALTPPQSDELGCPDTPFGGNLSWDPETQRCQFGGGGCVSYQ